MSFEVNRGDIFYIDRFGLQTGSEQRAGRPGIIVSNKENNLHSETVEVVYLTTAPKTDLPTHVNISSAARPSIALCEQITTVSTEKLGNFVGHCTKEEMFQIDLALIRSLGVKIPELRDLQKDLDAFIREKKAAQPAEPKKSANPTNGNCAGGGCAFQTLCNMPNWRQSEICIRSCTSNSLAGSSPQGRRRRFA